MDYEFKKLYQCFKIEKNYKLKALERHICTFCNEETTPEEENSWFIVDAIPPQDHDATIVSLKDVISNLKATTLQNRCISGMCKGQDRDQDVFFEVENMPHILIILVKRYSWDRKTSSSLKIKTKITITEQMELNLQTK